jgi:hypothetical protein
MKPSEDLEITIESEDDTRITLTVVSLEGRKISMAAFVMELELWIQQISEAEAERITSGATLQ